MATTTTTRATCPSSILLNNNNNKNNNRQNTLVAESDWQAAHQALQERLETTLAKYYPHNHDNNNHNEPERTFLRTSVASLCRNLDRIVQPMADAEFHAYIFQQQQQDDDIDDTDHGALANQQQDDDDDMDRLDDNDNYDDDDDYDDEDLLDPQAVARVQEMRQQVRVQAATVQALGQAVLRQAVALGERHVQLWEQEQPPEQETTLDNDITTTATTEQQEQHVAHWRAAVQQTLHTLTHHQTNLPTALERLQETVQAIQTTLMQQDVPVHQRSQTEQAILGAGDDHDAVHHPADTRVEQAPEERLAQFLGQ